VRVQLVDLIHFVPSFERTSGTYFFFEGALLTQTGTAVACSAEDFSCFGYTDDKQLLVISS
jgi:hypothetical protein